MFYGDPCLSMGYSKTLRQGLECQTLFERISGAPVREQGNENMK